MEILVVDDELPILELIKYNLKKEGFSVTVAENGVDALTYARLNKPDLIVLDVMLPDMSGMDICRILRNDKETHAIPIIMATAKTEDADIISGLELGADDYVAKPFSPRVLIARIRSVLRRFQDLQIAQKENLPEIEEKPIISIHGIIINSDKFEITKNGKQVVLSATEFSILQHLAKNPGKVFSRQQIINDIKGSSYPATERSIDVQILSIRKKLAEVDGSDLNNSIIETVRGVGYR
ncbi:MAG: response regulator transcription factor, partial [Spirochaetaceae bacterium]|nr:response regulator transcription factor [Spirochaetaceae bacterium]